MTAVYLMMLMTTMMMMMMMMTLMMMTTILTVDTLTPSPTARKRADSKGSYPRQPGADGEEEGTHRDGEERNRRHAQISR